MSVHIQSVCTPLTALSLTQTSFSCWCAWSTDHNPWWSLTYV